jgi:hypothetical protein
VKTRPGLSISRFVTMVLFRTGHVADINDVGGACWHGCDDPKPGLGDTRVQYRRQRVGSREVRILPPFVWAARIRVQPRHEGRDRNWRGPDLGMIFLLIGGRRWVPDLVGAKTVRRVLYAASGGIGTLTGMSLWSLF